MEPDDLIPPEVLASPNEVEKRPDDEMVWWRPSWKDTAGHVGYRWIFLLPLALGFVVFLGAFIYPRFFGTILLMSAKALIFFTAVAISLAAYVVRQAVRARSEPFCIHCGYNLRGLPDQYRCPECGRPYNWRLIAEYRRDPQWFVERWRAQHHLPPIDKPFAAGPPSTKRARRRSRDGTE